MNSRLHCVYVLQSKPSPERHYVGLTTDLAERMARHNAGQVPHTSKHLPWLIETAVAFGSRVKALAFEKHLKTHSGRAFASKHF